MGESSTSTIILIILLIIAASGTGYLYWQNTTLKSNILAEQQACAKTSEQLSALNRVIIAADGTISYPQAKKLYLYGSGTYTYDVAANNSMIGTPTPLDEQSDFSLCYTMRQNKSKIIISLKNAYSKEFYDHCKGDYDFPVLVDGKPFSAFTLSLIPRPEE